MAGCSGWLGLSSPLQQHYLPSPTSPPPRLPLWWGREWVVQAGCGAVHFIFSTTVPAQHPSSGLPASPSSGVDGGSTRLAGIDLTSATAPPALRPFRRLPASLPPPLEGCISGLTKPAAAADFIALYKQCLQNGLRASSSIMSPDTKNSQSTAVERTRRNNFYQQMLPSLSWPGHFSKCRWPTNTVTTTTNMSRHYHRHHRACQQSRHCCFCHLLKDQKSSQAA